MVVQNMNVRRYLTIFLNLSLIFFAFAVAILLAKQYFFTSEDRVLNIGDKIFINGTPKERETQFLVIFLRSGCIFCTKSSNFYKEISNGLSTSKNTRLFAAFSSSDDKAVEYLSQLGLSGLDTIRMNYRDIGIEGTPTIALIDSAGIVKDVWTGKLSHRREVEVKQTLGLASDSWYVEESEVGDVGKGGQTTVVVDVQDRDLYVLNHFKDAKNIPADEFPIRGINELSVDDSIFVYGTSEKDGEDARENLLKGGFKKVYILNYKFQNPSVPIYRGN